MIYIHSYSNQEDIVNAIESKQFSHTMKNQYTYYKSVPYHVLLMNPILIVQPLDEDLKLDNLILLNFLLDLVPLPIW